MNGTSRVGVWAGWHSTMMSRDCKQQQHQRQLDEHQQSGGVLAIRLGSGMIWTGGREATGTGAALSCEVPCARCQNGLDPILLHVEKLQMLRSPAVPADEKRFARVQRSGLIAHGQGTPSPNGHAVLCRW